MIAVIDYGMGNLESVDKAFVHLGFDVTVTSDPGQIAGADGVVLPGVGAFGDCMANLGSLGLVDVVKDAARTKPFLGICLGLQLLFEESEEFGPVRGLGLFPGRVKRFPAGLAEDGDTLKIPHMAWNAIAKRKETPVLEGIPDGTFFYFVHSYYVETAASLTATTTRYGIEYTSSVADGMLFACQFHPEKSQKWGLRLLENFGALALDRRKWG